MSRNAFLTLLVTAVVLVALPAAADGPTAFMLDGSACAPPTMSFPQNAEPADTSVTGPCNVSRLCLDGSTIACTGTSQCSSGPGDGGGWVECDGTRTYCPFNPDCNAGYFCKRNSDCYCYDLLCACTGKCICATQG